MAGRYRQVAWAMRKITDSSQLAAAMSIFDFAQQAHSDAKIWLSLGGLVHKMASRMIGATT
jgi:hypothetical protein